MVVFGVGNSKYSIGFDIGTSGIGDDDGEVGVDDKDDDVDEDDEDVDDDNDDCSMGGVGVELEHEAEGNFLASSESNELTPLEVSLSGDTRIL